MLVWWLLDGNLTYTYYQFYMEYTPRKQSFLNSTFCNQTHSPSQLSIDANRKKRFSRSNSHSHSKSKEHSKTTITTQTAQFYVKNICKNILSSSPQHLDIFNRISVSSRAKKQIIRRACTPAKSRPQPQKPAKDGQDNESDAESELNGLKMQWQLREAMAQKQRFQAQNKVLQQKLAALYLSLADCQGQNRLLKEKVRYLEQRDAVGRDSKVNSANRIKRLIIENKELEKPTAQNMEQTIKSLIMQNQQLRQSAKAAENKAKLIEKHFQAMANERQLFLEDLVQQLKIQLVQKDNTIKNLMIQLNIFLVRQSHRDRKEQQEKVQEFQNIKRKYIHVLTKYHEVNQQLSAFKRKDERKRYLFNDKYLSKNSSLDSLQFSP